MMNNKIEMVVFDMAGTTISDNNEVLNSFMEAAISTGLDVNRAQINKMMGWSKITVFETLWKEKLPNAPVAEIKQKANLSFSLFKVILEKHYTTQNITPTVGCMETFAFLKEKKVSLVLNTGFYTEVTNIILNRLGWQQPGKNNKNVRTLIDAVVCSDQVITGRPAPFMIFKAMELCDVHDVRKVIKIGDTPSDLYEGKNAGCLFSFGVTNGTHTRTELEMHEHDGLFENLFTFREHLESFMYASA